VLRRLAGDARQSRCRTGDNRVIGGRRERRLVVQDRGTVDGAGVDAGAIGEIDRDERAVTDLGAVEVLAVRCCGQEHLRHLVADPGMHGTQRLHVQEIGGLRRVVVRIRSLRRSDGSGASPAAVAALVVAFTVMVFVLLLA